MDTALHIAEGLLGLLVVAVVMNDVFQSIVVPRPSDRRFRLAPAIVPVLWRSWRWWAIGMRSMSRRENFLGLYAPFGLIALLIAWLLALVLGYGLMVAALGDQVRPPIDDFGSAVYLAAVSLLTIGYGDLVPVGGLARCVLLAAAMSGLGVLALLLSLIFSLHNAFGRRELYVIMLDGRAGSPPSGVTLLETFADLQIADTLPDTFSAWELWCAEMLQSHLAFPMLPYFRSLRENQSWVSSMGAVLDAATLLLTTVDLDNAVRDGSCRHAGLRGAATLTYTLGCQTVGDLTEFFESDFLEPLPDANPSGPIQDVLVDRTEFTSAIRRLERAGYQTRPADVAWQEFVRFRFAYATQLNALAKYFAAPPALWIGDRSAIPHRRAELPAAGAPQDAPLTA